LKAVFVPPGFNLSHSRAHIFRAVLAGPGRILAAFDLAFVVAGFVGFVDKRLEDAGMARSTLRVAGELEDMGMAGEMCEDADTCGAGRSSFKEIGGAKADEDAGETCVLCEVGDGACSVIERQ
jgi:hypothetical protein